MKLSVADPNPETTYIATICSCGIVVRQNIDAQVNSKENINLIKPQINNDNILAELNKNTAWAQFLRLHNFKDETPN